MFDNFFCEIQTISVQIFVQSEQKIILIFMKHIIFLLLTVVSAIALPAVNTVQLEGLLFIKETKILHGMTGVLIQHSMWRDIALIMVPLLLVALIMQI